MNIPVKLTISTRHILPMNQSISMYEQLQETTMEQLRENAMEDALDDMVEIPDPDDDSLIIDDFAAQRAYEAALAEDDDDDLDDDFDDDFEDDADTGERREVDLSIFTHSVTGQVPQAMMEAAARQDGDTVRKMLDAMLDKYFEDEGNDDNTGRYIFTTEAEMELSPGQIVLTYDEADDSTLGVTKNVIRFDRSNPHCLTIERTGELMNTLICEKGCRHTSVYASPMIPMPLEACTFTRRCDVDLDEEGGVVFLDYIIEIRGADVQRTTIRMNVVPMER